MNDGVYLGLKYCFVYKNLQPNLAVLPVNEFWYMFTKTVKKSNVHNNHQTLKSSTDTTTLGTKDERLVDKSCTYTLRERALIGWLTLCSCDSSDMTLPTEWRSRPTRLAALL